MKIAVIGGGLSGSLVTAYMARTSKMPITIYLFEKRPEQLNKGVAYSSRLPYQLLNVMVKDMSLFKDQPEHFANWLKERGYNYKPVDFAPRDIYGQYISETFNFWTGHKTDVNVKVVYQEATNICHYDNGYKISYGNGEHILVDKVVLCTGNFPPGDVPGLPQQIKESKNYISHPWGGFDIKSVPPENDVLMVGSGLTMIDLVLSLQKNGHKGKITVISRRGLLPLPHGDAPEYIPGQGPDLKNATATSLLDWVKKNVILANTVGKNWRSVIDSIRGYIPEMWNALPLEERKRFIRHLRPFWEIHRHRMPVESIETLKRMEVNGHLTFLAGRIQGAELKGNKAKVIYRCRNSKTLLDVTVDTIINCTGPETEYRKLRSPLYQSLIENKLAQTEPLSLGLMATTDGFVINASGKVDKNLAIIGPPAKGILWECTALREIRLQAETVSRKILTKPEYQVK
jgi:uncharacterized NAD(P)/FAD-binding protein YdhS